MNKRNEDSEDGNEFTLVPVNQELDHMLCKTPITAGILINSVINIWLLKTQLWHLRLYFKSYIL